MTKKQKNCHHITTDFYNSIRGGYTFCPLCGIKLSKVYPLRQAGKA
jgi:hypothetical protein